MFFNNNIESWIKKKCNFLIIWFGINFEKFKKNFFVKVSRYSNRVNAQENRNENEICTDQTEVCYLQKKFYY